MNKTPPPDTSTQPILVTAAFLKCLYDQPSLDLFDIVITTTDSDKGKRKNKWFPITKERTTNFEGILAHLKDQNQRSRNVYLNVNPRDRTKALPRAKEKAIKGWTNSAALSLISGTTDEVAAVVAFYGDIDFSAPGHKTADLLPEDEVRATIPKVPLPPSVLVRSGGGFYPFAILKSPILLNTDEDRRRMGAISQAHTRQYRDALNKGVDAAYDLTREVRLVGSFNRKKEREDKPEVKAWLQGDPYDYDHIVKHLPEPKKPKGGRGKKVLKVSIGDQTISIPDRRADYAAIVAGCAFFRREAENPTSQTYNNWMHALPIIVRCTDGAKHAHSFSRGYLGYSAEETDAKLYEAAKFIGPTTCKRIERDNPGICNGCTYQDIVKSPITVGDAEVLQTRLACTEHAAERERMGYPVIEVPHQGKAISPRNVYAQIEDAINATNDPPTLMLRDSVPVRIYGGHLSVVTPSILSRWLHDRTDPIKIIETKDGPVEAPCTIPMRYVNEVITDLPVPQVDRTTGAPIVREDFTIRTERGYDANTHLFYFPSVEINPCSSLQDAWNILERTFGTFPFETAADRANLYAYALTILLRHLFDNVPPLLAEAPQPRTGKDKMLATLGTIVVGAIVPATPWKKDEEMEKIIGGIYLSGAEVLHISNVVGTMKSAVIEGMVVANPHSVRKLGESTIISGVPPWVFISSNNATATPDLSERCVRVRLNARCATPGGRDFDFIPEVRALKERGEILGALLRIYGEYHNAGCPQYNGCPRFGSFETWTATAYNLLSFLHARGMLPFEASSFLEGRRDFVRELDSSSEGWAAFVNAGYLTWGDTPIPSATIHDEIMAATSYPGAEKNVVQENLPDTIELAMNMTTRGLGMRLGYRRGHRYLWQEKEAQFEVWFETIRDSVTNGTQYRFHKEQIDSGTRTGTSSGTSESSSGDPGTTGTSTETLVPENKPDLNHSEDTLSSKTGTTGTNSSSYRESKINPLNCSKLGRMGGLGGLYQSGPLAPNLVPVPMNQPSTPAVPFPVGTTVENILSHECGQVCSFGEQGQVRVKLPDGSRRSWMPGQVQRLDT